MFRDQAAAWWVRTRWARYAFIAGLLLGLLLGWAFYGLVSLVVRFFFVLIFLLPLLVVLYLWWRASLRSNPPDTGSRGPTFVTWDYPDDPLGGAAREHPRVEADPFDDPSLDDTIRPRRRRTAQASDPDLIQEADWRER